jgi:hypothetical protein
MITLRNYSSDHGSYIIIKNNTYSIEEDEDWNKLRQGIGGFQDGQMIGIYAQNDKLYFVQNEQVYETTPDDLKCTNKYISKLERCFNVTIGDRKICEIIYEPFIDPGMLIYDADPEEFDVLLYLSGLLKDKESIQNFIDGMDNLNKQNNE